MTTDEPIYPTCPCCGRRADRNYQRCDLCVTKGHTIEQLFPELTVTVNDN